MKQLNNISDAYSNQMAAGDLKMLHLERTFEIWAVEPSLFLDFTDRFGRTFELVFAGRGGLEFGKKGKMTQFSS